MTKHPLIFLHTCISEGFLHSFHSENKHTDHHWTKKYPALAVLNKMVTQNHTVTLPYHSPNTALNAYLLNQLALPINAGLALPQVITKNIIKSTQLSSSYWYRLSLVHWHAGRDRVHLIPLTSETITPLESLQLIEVIKPWFNELGWQIYDSSPQEYFIQTKEPFDYISPSLEVASSEQLEHFLPQGKNLKNWQTLLTEIQMIWFNHPVNEARKTAGLPTINSVWLDGMSHSDTWTTEALTNWVKFSSQIHHCQHNNINEYLQELNDLLSPSLINQKSNQPINITFIGDTWYQEVSFTQPNLLKRLKNKLTRQKPALQWLKIPTYVHKND